MSSARNYRDREEEGSPFLKSKKTQRSPAKATIMTEEKVDMMLQIMSNLSVQVQSLTSEVQKMGKKQVMLTEEIKCLRMENKKLSKENTEIKEEYTQMKREIRVMNRKVEKLEEAKREKNIVVTGIEIKTDKKTELKESIENFLKDALAVEVTVKIAHKLGPKSCLVELNTKEDKINVMKNKRKLKGIKGSKIFINNDLSPAERDIEKCIREIAREEKSKGKNVRYGYHKLTVDGKQYRWNRDKNAMDEIGATKVVSKN